MIMMYILASVVVIIASVSAVSASPLEHDVSMCSQGPAYWCETFEKAVECNALEHCFNNAWVAKEQKTPPHPVGDDMCDFCTSSVTTMQTFLPDNVTWIFEKALAKELACGGLPWIPKYKCRKLVDKVLEILWNRLDKTLSGPPEKVCIKIKLCKPVPAEDFDSKLIMAAPAMEQKGEGLSHIRAAILESASNNLLPQDKSFCSVCQFMARLILKMLENEETEDTIARKISSICGVISDTNAREMCVEIVDVLVKTVIEDLARGISNPLETCHALEMC